MPRSLPSATSREISVFVSGAFGHPNQGFFSLLNVPHGSIIA